MNAVEFIEANIGNKIRSKRWKKGDFVIPTHAPELIGSFVIMLVIRDGKKDYVMLLPSDEWELYEDNIDIFLKGE